MAREETIWYGKKKECGEIFLLRKKRSKVKGLVKEGEKGEIKRRNMFDHRRGGGEQRRKRYLV